MRMLIILGVLAASAYGQKKTESLYQEHCAHCHGIRLQGGNAQSLVDGVWKFGKGTSAISRNIKFGITHLGMPAYGAALTDKEIQSIAKYLQEAEGEADPTPLPIPRALQTLDYRIQVDLFAEGLDTPWDIAFLNKDSALLTELSGRLRVISDGRLRPKPVKGIPEVVAEGQGGLLAVAFDPDYVQEGNRWVYLAYSHGLRKGSSGRRIPAMTRVVRGRINGNNWQDEQVIFEAPHESYLAARHHYGTRLVFDREKTSTFPLATAAPESMRKMPPGPTEKSTASAETAPFLKATRTGTGKT